MKKIVGIDKEFGGGDVKGSVGANLSIEGSDLVADVNVKGRIPLEKVLAPVEKVVGDLVDKVEAWIPGDQKALAAGLKKDAMEQVVKLLSEQLAAPADPAPVA